MKIRKFKYLVGDFETTVYKGQDHTEVWAAACVELYTEDVHIFHSIDDQFEYLCGLNENVCVYYHNLKFDGSFWLDYLLVQLHWKQAFVPKGNNPYDVETLTEREMPNNSFKYSISDRGQWYSIIIKYNNHIIELRDSLKLLPFSVKRIGESFKTKHKKLDMEYSGFRYAGCPITDEEKSYIANDVLVVKEALEFMFDEGHQKLTIGSCCLDEYKKRFDKAEWKFDFPNLYEYPLNEEEHKYPNAGAWLRKSYKGGWCYLVKGKENTVKHNGVTADVNSLYPSMMHSESGNRYPIGEPRFWTGNYVPDEALHPNRFYFVRIRTRFYIKPGYLPFIQIKGDWGYKGTECLETSDQRDPETGDYWSYYIDANGNRQECTVELTLTEIDWILLREHYYLADCEILDGCWFDAKVGIFDEYINKYKEIKLKSKGATRELAKLFLNNLYGKMASSTDSSFKYAYIKEDKTIGFVTVHENDKEPGYIPVGSAITSYARNFTIRAAQLNYHGVDQPGFIYADTDSIHCDLPPDEIKGIKVHDKNFCCWKLEAYWDEAIFTRQKTYIEHVTHEDGEPIEAPYYNVKCAGMPSRCKDLFIMSMNGVDKESEKYKGLTDEQKEFLLDENGNEINRTIEDFHVGLKVPGKLMPRRIRGGVLLCDTTYEMR